MDRHSLTAREMQVAEFVAEGQTNVEIAASLQISASTVKSLLSNVMIKWNCVNRTQVGVAVARRLPDATPNATHLSA